MNRYFFRHFSERSIASAAFETSPLYCSKNAALCARVNAHRVSMPSSSNSRSMRSPCGAKSSAPCSRPVNTPTSVDGALMNNRRE